MEDSAPDYSYTTFPSSPLPLNDMARTKATKSKIKITFKISNGIKSLQLLKITAGSR